MKKNGNEKTKLKLKKKYTLSDNWNTYDPFGEAFFFAAGPFCKHSVFLTQAFAFGCGFFLAPAFAFGCSLLRDNIIIFITIIYICFTIHFGMMGGSVLNCCVVLSAMMCPSRVGVVPFASLAIDELLPIFKRNISTKLCSYRSFWVLLLSRIVAKMSCVGGKRTESQVLENTTRRHTRICPTGSAKTHATAPASSVDDNNGGP